MYFKKFLERYFDVEKSIVFAETDKDKRFPLERYELSERDNDCEFMFSLTLVCGTEEEELEKRISGLTNYRVGNVYSGLIHDAVMEEKELRKLIKSGNYFKKK